MTITTSFSEPFFTGTSAASADILGKYDVALNGRPFLIDTRISAYTGHSEFMHSSVPIIRNQADQASSPSEASINPIDLWRRSVDTWHKGAGQAYFDRADSDAARFSTSKGVDVWTKWQLSLLKDTGLKRASANTNLALVPVGARLYLIDGTDIVYTTDVTVGSPTWTGITGESGTAANGVATDGFHLWTINGTDGLYQTDNTASAIAKGVTGNLRGMLAYVKGRILASDNASLYNITTIDTGTPSALPTALFTHPNADWEWVGAAEGLTCIYVAGFSGDKSVIYRTSIRSDGTALDIPVVAGELPDGEIVRSIQGYLGFVLIGTDKGVRFAAASSDGALTLGSLIPTGAAVRCFEPQDRFCWYGLTNYDAASTGLGRIDLSVLTAPLTPAYASDLMATAQGAVLSAVTFQGIRVFAVSGVGIYAELTTLVATGTINSGQITYRLPDDKRVMFVDVRHDETGSHTVWLSRAGAPLVSLGTHTAESDPFPAGQALANRHEIRLVLNTVSTVGPVIRSVTMRAYPVVATIEMIVAPLLLAETLRLHDGTEETADPAADLAAIAAMRDDRTLVTWQEGDQAWSVVVEDYEWRPVNQTEDFKFWNGTCVAQMKVIA